MSLFCLLWVPFFLMLRRSLIGGEGGSIIALLFGSITAVTQYLLGDLVTPGGFDFSRWIYGFVDIVCLPVLLPIFIYAITLIFRNSQDADFASFTLFWLIPVSAFRALSWSAGRDAVLLIAVPLLWTAIAVGISFFIHLMFESYNSVLKIGCFLCILLLPVTGAFTYWAFFCQKPLLGFIFFFVTQIPVVLSFVKR